MPLLTYDDAVRALQDFAGGTSLSRGMADIKAAILSALGEVYRARSWSYYKSTYGFSTNAEYATGTITYTHTGGTYERQLTLSGGTFPTWIEQGGIIVDSTAAAVERKVSSTVLILDENQNFGEDIASGTSYTAFQDEYALPDGFQNLECVIMGDGATSLRYVPPETLLYNKTVNPQTGDPSHYSIIGNELTGRYSLALWPAPNAVDVYRVSYRRAYRMPRLTGDEVASTVGTVTLSNGATRGSGTSTTFNNSLHKGTVMRLGDATNVPTARHREWPYVEQHIVRMTSGNTGFALATAVGQAFSGVKYKLSDPIDIPPALENVFLVRCKIELALNRMDTKKMDLGPLTAMYEDFLSRAAAADNKNRQRSSPGMLTPGFDLSEKDSLADDDG